MLPFIYLTPMWTYVWTDWRLRSVFWLLQLQQKSRRWCEYLLFDKERPAKTRRPGKFKKQQGDKSVWNWVGRSDQSMKMEVRLWEERGSGMCSKGALWATERNLFFSTNSIEVYWQRKIIHIEGVWLSDLI